MSRLYINDLENIKNGKIVRFELKKTFNNNSLIPLYIVNEQRRETKNLRDIVVEKFKNDVQQEFDKRRGSKIETPENIMLYPDELFFKDYLNIIIPTILGNTHCLLSNDGIVTSSSDTNDLNEKVEIILPYVKKLLKIKKESKVLDNEFFEDLDIVNQDNEKVLYLNGGGVFLPFNDYQELPEYDLQELLLYYYHIEDILLKNILINNDIILDRFKPDITKEKILKLYKD